MINFVALFVATVCAIWKLGFVAGIGLGAALFTVMPYDYRAAYIAIARKKP